MDDLSGATIRVTGVVQGVGYRPFVYDLARRLALTGWVRNTTAGVDIEAEGAPAALSELVQALRTEAPPLARIEAVHVAPRPTHGFADFVIAASVSVAEACQPVSPDAATCAECLRELADPADRRFQYPFINCTHCGPRFTIIQELPYDRPLTTMAAFQMCADCESEYTEPSNRRFHAQPVACPVCGPQVWLEIGARPGATPPGCTGVAATEAARRLLVAGAIVALKGLGGFHLACDATNAAAVAELRRRKRRPEKPLALMLADLAQVDAHCEVGPDERALLVSPARPIVLVRRRPTSPIARAVAPGLETLGIMLPYTPLHSLLLAAGAAPLVMTSGNVSDEPMVTTNAEARDRLTGLADACLMHDRDIVLRCDDSVVRASPEAGAFYPLRHARGYAPTPVKLPIAGPTTLAAGGDLKAAFCLTRGHDAFLSPHIGDLASYGALQAYTACLAHYERLFRARPEIVAHDLHPDYFSTRLALERARACDLPAIAVQHHHAHVAACLADNACAGQQPVIGVAFDGAGYGVDGAIWGGEFLIADYRGFERPVHLAYVPLAGGDRAAREPWRMALAWLAHAGLDWAEDLPPVCHARAHPTEFIAALDALRGQLRTGLNSPPTSSVGRLFDAVAALIGVRQTATYEGQPAIELEDRADPNEAGTYDFELLASVLEPGPMIAAIVEDFRSGVALSRIAARFHNTLAAMTLEVCRVLRARHGLADVALSGGVWQNMTLLRQTRTRLVDAGFRVYLHRQAPANDGGLALGQAAVALARLND